MPAFHFILLALSLCFSSPISLVTGDHEIPHRNLADSICPLDFTVVRKFIFDSPRRPSFLDVPRKCQTLLQGIRLVRSNYLRVTGNFSLSPIPSEVCLDVYQKLVNELVPWLDIRSTCAFDATLLSKSCNNITTRFQFEGLISKPELQEVNHLCNRSLDEDSSCTPCQGTLYSIYQSYFIENASDCSGYPFIYAGALANREGPADSGTAKCLFSLDYTSTNANNWKKKAILCATPIGAALGLIMTVMVIWFSWRRKQKWKRRHNSVALNETGAGFGIETISGDSSLVMFTFEEIKKATKNFSRENIIGKGGYGNVYKGILEDGSEVALKRFKNCSAAGDATFAHEVEVIASINHVNLVPFRGYCTATVPMEGHQRIIVCDLMQNGSLYDHLFGSEVTKLSWPIRQKIAIGVARGLAYLHYGAQPAIIHRDVKASNILLDDTFEPKLADFGLAKFTPDDFSHMSTRVAGTLGYVAPEYALYGQLTERSDVYGFGVVLLELLSSKQAVISINDHHTLLLTDWAWSLVEEGRLFDVIDENVLELGPPEVMEKYVLLAILSCHSQLYARPTMDQIVRILETDIPKSANFRSSRSMSSACADDKHPCNCNE
ncbi:hypothetical protein E1A91_D11G303100v1 [Gossypium mustelinum]|uniref:non-specific serine/threonine protein kinase n=1 Tax=Gossypium mustelinum TaxID=34275 RepID=A0A5D2SZD8_GOSMU|nr:hypothetical protein E1A91_D11G303100v1 [Gossypium mustelinum]